MLLSSSRRRRDVAEVLDCSPRARLRAGFAFRQSDTDRGDPPTSHRTSGANLASLHLGVRACVGGHGPALMGTAKCKGQSEQAPECAPFSPCAPSPWTSWPLEDNGRKWGVVAQ